MGANTPLVLYTNIPTGSSFQMVPETQAGIPVSSADKLRPRLSPFVIRILPPAVLQGIVESGGPDDPYSIRNLVVNGGALAPVAEIVSTGTQQVYGQVRSYIPDGRQDAVVYEGQSIEVDSYTPLDFIDEFCINDRGLSNGNNFGYTRSNNSTHWGVDVYVDPGSPVYAPFDAEVTFIQVTESPVPQGSNGGYIRFRSTEDPGLFVNFVHLETVEVSRNQVVTRGQRVGTTINRRFDLPGEGGSRSHLHAEVSVATGGYNNPDAQEGNISPFSVLNVAELVFTPDSEEGQRFGLTGSSVASGLPVKVVRDISQQSQIAFYSQAAAPGAADPYSNPLAAAAVSQIVSLPREQLQEFVYQGQRVTSLTPETTAIVDRAYRADILLQIQDITKAPPLVMMINPSSFSVSHPRTQQYSNVARGAYIFEEFRQDIYTLSGTLQFGGFMAADGVRRGFNEFAPSTPTGLQNAAMLDSAAWQQLQAVLAIYQNNGAVFDRINNIKSRPLVGSVVIEWDGWQYEGKFTSFSFTFDETQPHYVNAEFQFEATSKTSFVNDFDLPVPLTDLNGGNVSEPRPQPVSPAVQAFSRRVVSLFQPPETSPAPNLRPFGRR